MDRDRTIPLCNLSIYSSPPGCKNAVGLAVNSSDAVQHFGDQVTSVITHRLAQTNLTSFSNISSDRNVSSIPKLGFNSLCTISYSVIPIRERTFSDSQFVVVSL